MPIISLPLHAIYAARSCRYFIIIIFAILSRRFSIIAIFSYVFVFFFHFAATRFRCPPLRHAAADATLFRPPRYAILFRHSTPADTPCHALRHFVIDRPDIYRAPDDAAFAFMPLMPLLAGQLALVSFRFR
jgi:hypothetical protein